MTSGGGPEGYCKNCGEYSQSRTIESIQLCMACSSNLKYKEVNKIDLRDYTDDELKKELEKRQKIYSCSSISRT